MKQITNTLLIVFLTLSVLSCERIKPNAIVKAKTVEVSGDLSKYLQIVDSEYEIVPKSGGKISIEVKAISAYENSLEDKKIDITASLFKENGSPLSGVDNFKLSYADRTKLKTLLKNGSGEEVLLLEGLFGGYDNQKHADIVKSFKVTSSLTEKKKTTKSKSQEKDKSELKKEAVAKKSSNKWDKTLDTYSEYVDQYIVLMKKANKGDLDALSEYPSMMQKATKLNEQLKDAGNDLTPKQLKRMTAIQTKMTNALYDMQ